MMRGHGKAERADEEGDDPGSDELTAQPRISSVFEHDATPICPQVGKILPSSIDSSEEPAGYVTIA
jgi:hypothetical protein